MSKDDLKFKSEVYDRMSTLSLDSSVTNLTNAFRDNPNYVNVPSIVANNVTESSSAFKADANLLSVGEINFPNCNNFRSMFQDCFNLKTFPIKPENFKNDTTYMQMYQNCYNLTEEVSNINVNNCDFTGVFKDSPCRNIYNLSIRNSNLYQAFMNPVDTISNINSVHYINNCVFADCNMIFAFKNVKELEYGVYELSNIQFTNCIMNETFSTFRCVNSFENIAIEHSTTRYTFAYMYRLTNMSDITISNMYETAFLFSDCHNLVNVTNMNIYNVGSLYDMFYGCTNLAEIPVLNLESCTNLTRTFAGCPNLSADAYANIANSLPLASNLTNQYISNIGLDINKFTNEQLSILNVKGYTDAIPPAPPTPGKLTYYNIYYDTLN